jgi:hypothetical protein
MRLQVALALTLVLVAHQTQATPIGHEDCVSEDLSLDEINRLIAQRDASLQQRSAATSTTSTTAAPTLNPSDGLADEIDLETINRKISERDAKEGTKGAQQAGAQKVTMPAASGHHQEADNPKDQARLLEMREQCRLAAEVRSHGPERAPVHPLPRTKKSPPQPVQTSAKLNAGDVGTNSMDESATEQVLSREELETRRLMRERCAKAAERRALTE